LEKLGLSAKVYAAEGNGLSLGVASTCEIEYLLELPVNTAVIVDTCFVSFLSYKRFNVGDREVFFIEDVIETPLLMDYDLRRKSVSFLRISFGCKMSSLTMRNYFIETFFSDTFFSSCVTVLDLLISDCCLSTAIFVTFSFDYLSRNFLRSFSSGYLPIAGVIDW
jgi:hypothetical protein